VTTLNPSIFPPVPGSY
jgi:alpha-galactosidase